MTYETLILPKEFFETQLYIELPYEYLDHLEEIAQNNNLTLWKPGALKLWIEDRKQSGTPICIYKTNDEKLCCCSRWWAEQQHKTHDIVIVDNLENRNPTDYYANLFKRGLEIIAEHISESADPVESNKTYRI